MNKNNILLLVFYIVSSFVVADDSQELSDLLKNYQSMSGQFEQTLVDDQQQLIQESSGSFIVKKPGYFRWDTRKPFPQLLVSDLQNIWLYDPDLEQVTVRSYRQSVDQTPALLLSGDAEKITQYYQVNKISGIDTAFVLTPKAAETSFTELRLSFINQQLTAMVMIDSLQQTTRFQFSQVEFNQPIPESSFQFTPPGGVNVLRDD